MSCFFLLDDRTTWTELKNLSSSKSLFIQYQEDVMQYYVFAIENKIVHWTEIWKEGVTLPSGIDESTNTSNRTDFETNYKSIANQSVLDKVALYDSEGTEINSETVSGIHMLNTKSHAEIFEGDNGPVDIITDTHNVDRLAVEAGFPPGSSIIIGNTVPTNLQNLVRSWISDTEGEIDLAVNGSITPVVFTYDADPDYDIELYEIRFCLGSQDMYFTGDKFVNRDALANGILIEVVSNNIAVEIGNLQITEDFLMFPSPANVVLNNTGPKDILLMGLLLGGAPVLRAGTNDRVQITVRDDLSGGGVNAFTTFCARVFGVKLA